MKLCLIYEQGDYAGLEDADEFESDDLVLNCFNEFCDNPAEHACPICHEELCGRCYKTHMMGPCGQEEGLGRFVDEINGMMESYEGLEDEDEFGEPSLGLCFGCGQDVPEDTLGPWICRRCDVVAHFSCAMPTQEDIRKYDASRQGITSTGWRYFPGDPNEPGVPFITNANVLDGSRVLAATRAYDTYLCPDCARELSESYEGLEDEDEFDSGEIEWRSVYQGEIPNTSVRWVLLVDVNNMERFAIWLSPTRGNFGEPVDNWQEIDEFDLQFIQELATWLGLNWSYRMSQESLVDGVLDKLYLRSLEHKDRWNWPPQWGRLWDPPRNYPPAQPPNWYY